MVVSLIQYFVNLQRKLTLWYNLILKLNVPMDTQINSPKGFIFLCLHVYLCPAIP